VRRAPTHTDALGRALAGQLGAPSWLERQAAARTLAADARLARVALPALLQAAGDETGFVREAACAALGATRDGRARAALETRRAGDGVATVREAAARALGALGRPAD